METENAPPSAKIDSAKELPPMPEWARLAKEGGCDIVFRNGVWKAIIT